MFRSTRKQKETEPEPELSVEALLESTAEAEDELEDIGYSEKSETRILIEKFVDEKPDAAALLLLFKYCETLSRIVFLFVYQNVQ